MAEWGAATPTGLLERIRKDRIKVAVAAWAYENGHRPIMSDTDYDNLAIEVDKAKRIATGNSRLDNFFRRHFTPSTGLWVHKHPNQRALEHIYATQHKRRRRR